MSTVMRGKPQVLRRIRPPMEGSFCNYSHRQCMQNRLEGFEYCIKHILEDKNAPYKQCNYMSQRNGKRCPNAAPKVDKKDGYCPDHARRAALHRQRSNRKRRPRETPETLLEQIEHYASKPVEAVARDAHKRISRPAMESVASRILDYASSSESDVDPPLIEQAWRGDGDSDAESVDSEQEDTLKHAGVYTAEEVALVTRDKLIRLQSLYIDQFKRLQHVMREKRRRYIHSVKMERETLASVGSAKEDPDQRDKYEKLVAMKRYHKRYGKEALLHRQSKERRIEISEGNNYKPPAHPRCIYMDGNKKCGSRTVPLSKFCFNHVMQDPLQVLYAPCGYGNGACVKPVIKGICGLPRCSFHPGLEDGEIRMPTKEEEEEEKEDDTRDISIDIISDSDLKLIVGASPSASTSTTTDDVLSQPRAGSPTDLGQVADTEQLPADVPHSESSTPVPMDTSPVDNTPPVKEESNSASQSEDATQTQTSLQPGQRL